MRHYVADTTAYVAAFNNYSTNFSEEFSKLNWDPWSSEGKGVLFNAYSIFFKCFISDNYTLWLSSIAIFSGVVVTFIGTGSSVYRSTSSSSKVQMETQETFDKIEDLIIDANRSLYYAYGSGSEIGAQITNDIIEKGGDRTNSSENKTFIACNEYANSDGKNQSVYL